MSDTKPWTDEQIKESAENYETLLLGHATFAPREWFEGAMTEVRDDMQATIDGLRAQSQTDYQAGWQMGYEKGQRHDFVLVGRLEDRIAALESQLATLQAATPVGLDAPDSAGWWAFEGRYRWNPPTHNLRLVFEVCESNNGLTIETQKGHYTNIMPVKDMLFGKWCRMPHMPWEAVNATPAAATLSPTERGIIEAMRDDWLQRHEPGSDEWADAQVIAAWLNGYKGTMYGDATPVADAEGVVWEPIEDGEVSSFMYVDNGGKLIGVFAGDDYTDWYATEDLPDHIRLCQRRPHAQQDSQEGVGDAN